MTKQPPYATTRLSKLCRWIVTLGVMKLALLTGLLMPDVYLDKSAGGLLALAAGPFSTSPERPQTASRLERQASTPAFGLADDLLPVVPAPVSPASTGSAASGDGLTPPPPRINPGQSSPFAQPLPEYTRPDEARPGVPPAPSIKPIVPRDSAARSQEEFSRRERELLALRQQMDSRLDELKKIEGNVQTMLKQADTGQDEKMRHLVDVYTNMKAKQAAEVLTNLEERIAVKILSGMRGRQAGEILTYMRADKAAKLSEALTRTQLPQ